MRECHRITHALLNNVTQRAANRHGFLPLPVTVGKASAQVNNFQSNYARRSEKDMIAGQGGIMVNVVMIIERLEGFIKTFFWARFSYPAIRKVDSDHRRAQSDN